MQSSFGLIGDFDDVDLVRDVAQAFQIRFLNDDAARCRTVGDLFVLVVSELPPSWQDGDRCAEAMCFYRLRRAVLTLAPHLDLRPSTPIIKLRGVPVRQLHHAIRGIGGLRPPAAYLSVWGGLSLLLAVAAPAGQLLLGVPWWTAVVWMIATATCYQRSPIRLPPNLSTFGDLVKFVTASSIGILAAEGARLRPAEVWKALEAVCAGHSAKKGGKIGMGTLILKRATTP